MPYLTCNGISVYYEIYGEGQPTLLISGLGGDRTFWQPSIEKFAAKFQIILFDTRGIGRTDAPEGPYSIDLFADDLASLMEGLHIESAHILGYSMGGNIALKFALKYPEKIKKLIVAASCAALNAQIRLYVDAILEVYEGGISTKQMFSLVAPWLFSAEFLNKPGNAAYLQYDENDPEQQPLYAWKSQYLAQREFDITRELQNIDLPVLILAGEQDLFANLHDAKILHEGIPGSLLQVIPRAGHLFNYEMPDEFHSLTIDFFVA
ncbi:MAG: alpha/beta fold hydrolase [Bacteroidota bacterium]